MFNYEKTIKLSVLSKVGCGIVVFEPNGEGNANVHLCVCVALCVFTAFTQASRINRGSASASAWHRQRFYALQLIKKVLVQIIVKHYAGWVALSLSHQYISHDVQQLQFGGETKCDENANRSSNKSK